MANHPNRILNLGVRGLAIPQKEFLRRVRAVHGRAYRLHSALPYSGVKHQVSLVCGRCGHGSDGSWTPYCRNILTGSGCPRCGAARQSKKMTGRSSEKRSTRVAYIRRLTVMWDTKIQLRRQAIWQGIGKPCYHQCNRCGYGKSNEWSVKPTVLVNRGAGCPLCDTERGHKPYQLGNRLVYVRGYEDRALDWIFSNTQIKPIQIRVDSERGAERQRVVPAITFQHQGYDRAYWPDFYVASRNLLIEVKSLWTLGLRTNEPEVWKLVCAKARAAVEQGFEFKLLIFEGYEPLTLPANWHRKRFSTMLRHFNLGKVQ